MTGNGKVERFLYKFLDLHHARIAKLEDLLCVIADDMIVLSISSSSAAPSRATTPKEYFSLKQLSKWRQRTRELNQNSRGDQAAFVLQKARI